MVFRRRLSKAVIDTLWIGAIAFAVTIAFDLLQGEPVGALDLALKALIIFGVVFTLTFLLAHWVRTLRPRRP